MNKAYFILVATTRHDNVIEMLFGDYDKEVVEQEKIDARENDHMNEYKAYRVIRLANDTQDHIDGILAGLNA